MTRKISRPEWAVIADEHVEKSDPTTGHVSFDGEKRTANGVHAFASLFQSYEGGEPTAPRRMVIVGDESGQELEVPLADAVGLAAVILEAVEELLSDPSIEK
ncbi:hypothetical protein [Agromyces indicus]|uniref:DUF1876 domain-containing protein n=1 Tax=Agromyces indicus TaxID=758919 RepID=A0ABU1FJH5_9MICO|nr:hypothetical protein [Agromyces indicus]MDR5691904.1 hypothetical protein [Agromyces indicus]